MDPLIGKSVNRKLAAILSADAVGYSRLMDDNEEATVKTLNACRELIHKQIEQYKGRVVDTTDDNLLAEFASAVNAVVGAVEIQRELAGYNAGMPAVRKMLFRNGLLVGGANDTPRSPNGKAGETGQRSIDGFDLTFH